MRSLGKLGLGVLALAVAGCGSSGGGDGSTGGGADADTTDQSGLTLADYQSQQDALRGFANSRFDAVPSAGKATYDGTAFVQLFTQPNNAAFVGDARVNVDFATDRVTGRVNQLSGVDRFDEDVTVTGSLRLSGVVGAGRANQITGSVQGELEAGDSTINVLSGALDLDFKGTPVRGLVGGAQLPTVIYDGAGYSGLMGIAVD